MTERMHRLQIGTMDGIFAKVARSFGPTVGLPPVWTIALPEQAARLAESAADELLAGGEGAEVKRRGGSSKERRRRSDCGRS